jgi:hypothetical protein
MNKSLVLKALRSLKGNSKIDVDFNYVAETFHEELAELATQLLQDNTFYSWKFTEKVLELVRGETK